MLHRLLRAFPGPVRAQIGAELVDSVLRRVDEKRARGGRLAASAHFARECLALLRAGRTARRTLAPAVRLRQREWGPRDEGGLGGWRERWGSELGHALRRRPLSGLAVGALTAAGVALGGSAVSAAYGPLLRTVPFAEAGGLLHVWTVRPWLEESRGLLADAQARAFVDGRAGLDDHLLEGAAAFRMVSGRVLGGPRPVHAEVGRVSAGFFDLLGVQAEMGRTFRPGEDRLGAPWVAVVSHDFWMEALGGDPDVVGRRLTIGWPEMEVVGVLPADFSFRVPEELGLYGSPDVWIPWWHHVTEDRGTGGTLALIARLAPGVSPVELQAALGPIGAEESRLHYAGRGFRFKAEALRTEWLRGRHGTLLAVWTGGLSLLVLTAAGATLLLLARHAGRGADFFLMRSLGASSRSVAGTALLESGIWLAGGGILGAVAGRALVGSPAGHSVVEALAGQGLSEGAGVPLVLMASALGVAALAQAPVAVDAVRRSRSSPRPNPFEERRGPGVGRRLLLTAQVAAACGLLVAAGAVGVAVRELAKRDLGYDPTNRIAFDLYLMNDYPDLDGRAAFHEALRERLLALPDVRSVGGSSALPMGGGLPKVVVSSAPRDDAIDTSGILLSDDFTTLAAGRLTGTAGEDWRLAHAAAVQPGHVGAMGMTLLSGRDLSVEDGASDPPVIMVDSATALALLGTVELEGGERLWAYGGWRGVVGVVRPAGGSLLGGGPAHQVYLPYAQVNSGRVSVVVETRGDGRSTVDAVAAVVASLDPDVPISDVRYLEEFSRGAERRDRLASAVLWAFGWMGGAAVALSLYGVLALDVRRRRSEMALRRAVGAAPAGLVAMVLRDGVGIAVPGVVLGLGGAAVLARQLSDVLGPSFGPDRMAFFTAGAAVLSVVLLAAVVPAVRAASVDTARELARDG